MPWQRIPAIKASTWLGMKGECVSRVGNGHYKHHVAKVTLNISGNICVCSCDAYYCCVCVFIVVDCGVLDSPENGLISFTSTTFASVATYTCFEDFELIGVTQRVCQLDGSWSGQEPICRSM